MKLRIFVYDKTSIHKCLYVVIINLLRLLSLVVLEFLAKLDNLSLIINDLLCQLFYGNIFLVQNFTKNSAGFFLERYHIVHYFLLKLAPLYNYNNSILIKIWTIIILSIASKSWKSNLLIRSYSMRRCHSSQ